MSIDPLGRIKNYPSHAQYFGQMAFDKLEAVIHSPAFREKWSVTNDEIVNCRDCPFRYVCVFNSDLEKRGTEWYKLEDCSYDLETRKWANAY